MSTSPSLTVERIDDIPLLLAQLERMGIRELLDLHCPMHGNWLGLSLGWTATLWLTHLLSEGDHRLNQVETLFSVEIAEPQRGPARFRSVVEGAGSQLPEEHVVSYRRDLCRLSRDTSAGAADRGGDSATGALSRRAG